MLFGFRILCLLRCVFAIERMTPGEYCDNSLEPVVMESERLSCFVLALCFFNDRQTDCAR